MNGKWLLVALAVGAGLALAGEIGTRFETGESVSTGIGWLSLSSEVGGLTLSGRAEMGLLPLRPRRIALGAGSTWDGWSLNAETILLPTGRLDLAVTAGWKGATDAEFGTLSSVAGTKMAWIDVLGVRFPTAAAWASARIDRVPFWFEANLSTTWPGDLPRGELQFGLSGTSWATVAISSTAASLELGCEDGILSAMSYLSLFPVALQSIAVGMGEESLRIQGRLTVRALGKWSGSVSVAASAGDWRASVTATFSQAGWEKTTVEVKLVLGE
ncbi:hypothetical protein H5T53_06390 [Candidatus Bipolaricaulota bacterium]|nr:hypothetical protein [Candidatus Bipolaricaulota bacterium]